jgi:large subunit ribosomal protein L10
LNRTEKGEVIAGFSEKLKGFQAVVLTNYRGLAVEQMNQLRRRLREEKISYQVVKNTLMRLASEGTDLEKLDQYFEGPTAIAIAYDDPVPLAKILSDFVKTQPKLEIKAGLVQGRAVPSDQVKALATMPSREIILGKVLGTVQGPAAQMGGILYNALQQVLGILKARVDQLSQQTPDEAGSVG